MRRLWDVLLRTRLAPRRVPDGTVSNLPNIENVVFRLGASQVESFENMLSRVLLNKERLQKTLEPQIPLSIADCFLQAAIRSNRQRSIADRIQGAANNKEALQVIAVKSMMDAGPVNAVTDPCLKLPNRRHTSL